MTFPGAPRLGLRGQFVLFTLTVLVAGMTILGLWVQSSIVRAVVDRTAGVTALYMDSFVSPLIQSLADGSESLDPEATRELERLVTETALGSQVVSVKIWSLDGRVLYSPNPDLVGVSFPIDDQLAAAMDGQVVSLLSSLDREENEFEASQWSSLIETYAPVRSVGTGEVIAVSEFYQLSDELRDEVRRVQRRGWLIVGAATILMFLVLTGLVQRAASTIEQQRSRLERNVVDLESTLEQNRRLQRRLRTAAARTSSLNERMLRRISADLHDGPAQDLSVALLLVDDIAAATDPDHREDVDRVGVALDSALSELRTITQSLRVPTLEGLTAGQVAHRAVEEFEHVTGERVGEDWSRDGLVPAEPVGIAIYRVVQESLMNSYKHAQGARRSVRVASTSARIEVSIIDDGAGFDPDAVRKEHSLGLTGMKERVEVLGGTFRVTSGSDAGTTVTVDLPDRIEEHDD